MPWINENRCTGCGQCVEACPEDAIELVDGKAQLTYRDCRRLMCGKCRKVCSFNAIMPGFDQI